MSPQVAGGEADDASGWLTGTVDAARRQQLIGPSHC